jgi:hypothetical protein
MLGHMSVSQRGWPAVFVATVLLLSAQVSTPLALADPELPPVTDDQPVPLDVNTPDGQPQFGEGPHNVVYRARVDGVSRGASITYKLSDVEFNTADPTMVPGRMFEATGVVSDPHNAGMQVSIQWPYSASLHCEILVDDQIISQADQFVAPRLTPQRNDPGYGVLSCGTVTNFPTGNTEPIDAPPPVEPAPPVEGAPPDAPPVT